MNKRGLMNMGSAFWVARLVIFSGWPNYRWVILLVSLLTAAKADTSKQTLGRKLGGPTVDGNQALFMGLYPK